MSIPWSNHEVELIIADYFSMLLDELAGKPINKTAHRRQLIPLLNGRSDKSIEFKHMNVSAVLNKFGRPNIVGYRPLWNYQQILEKKVQEYMQANRERLEPYFELFTQTAVPALPKVPTNHFERWREAPPQSTLLKEPDVPYFRPFKINYLEREQNNRNLGEAGERFALEYEKWQLIKAGKESLADKVEWVSKEQGDGAGFDILSRNLNGTDRYIEVKTTKLGKEAPFFFSKNEFDFSTQHSERYHLYRIFNFVEKPKMFAVQGKFDDFCRVEAVGFRGSF